MSDVDAFWLLAAVLLGILVVVVLGASCTILSLKRMHQRCDEIVTGVVNNIPVSVEYRWLLLFQDYLMVGSAVVLINVALAAGFFVLAGDVQDPGVKAVAYLCAGGFGWGAVMTGAFSLSWVLHLRTVLRPKKK